MEEKSDGGGEKRMGKRKGKHRIGEARHRIGSSMSKILEEEYKRFLVKLPTKNPEGLEIPQKLKKQIQWDYKKEHDLQM